MGWCVVAVLVVVVMLGGVEGTFANGRAQGAPAATPASRIRTEDKAQETPEASVVTQVPRVRAGSQRLKALIDRAVALSPTFRNLVSSIEATDGIVQVQEGRCPLRVAGCLVWRMTLAAPYRMLFVMTDAKRSDIEVMASVAHELRHALEVFENPSLKRNSDIALFYLGDKRLTFGQSIETAAAVAAGDAVFNELKQDRSGGAR